MINEYHTIYFYKYMGFLIYILFCIYIKYENMYFSCSNLTQSLEGAVLFLKNIG